MTITDMYLICFIVGLLLSLISFIFGTLHLHMPGLGHGPHLPHVGHLPHPPQWGHGGGHAPHGGGGSEMPLFNFGTVTAFLAWFGGVGYLLTRHTHLYAVTAIVLSSLAGVVGAALVFLFVARVLMRHEKNLDPADYSMIGVLGSVSSPIRQGGTGEIVYAQEGTRRVTGARSDVGVAIAKGVEVVVTRYEKGIAYVRPWEELSASGQDVTKNDSVQARRE
jgi:membrane protein implicated in regulation of membrane protease activity